MYEHVLFQNWTTPAVKNNVVSDLDVSLHRMAVMLPACVRSDVPATVTIPDLVLYAARTAVTTRINVNCVESLVPPTPISL